MKILLCEDERELSNAVSAILRHHNYTVDAVYDGQNAYDYGLTNQYDVILLDIMMPKMDGLSVLNELRNKGIKTPVLILSAKGEVSDKIKGLDLGADDYLSKPFSMAEMIARIRAITRRRREEFDTQISFHDLVLNRLTYELSVGNNTIHLSSKEYQMMEMLIMHPNVVISTETFMEKIWGFDSESEINVVWVYISALRKKIFNLNANVVIKAARGVGYRLEKIND